MIYIKLGVVIAALQDEGLLEPAIVADEIWHEQGWGHVRITGGIDGNHLTNSYHYGAGAKRGQALDLGFPAERYVDMALDLLKARLPKKWKVLKERDHYHVQPA